MATVLVGAGALLAAGTALRMGLRTAARNGARLSPLMQSIAGNAAVAGGAGGSAATSASARYGKATNGQEWIVGGFQSKMDRKEAAHILGLRWATTFSTSKSRVAISRSSD